MNEANTHAEALGPAGESLDQAHERLGHTAPRVTPADLEANIASEWFFTAGAGVAGAASLKCGMVVTNDGPEPPPLALALLTICVLVTRNGFTIVGTSSPASPANFNAELGRKLARENAVRQLWPLMGYALRERLARVDEPDMETPHEKSWREAYEARIRCHQRIERSQRVSRWMLALLVVAALAAILPWELLLR